MDASLYSREEILRRAHGGEKLGVKCKDCGTEDESRHYQSGKMPRCYDCQNYHNLVKKPTGGGVEFTREQYLEWKEKGNRRCTYCGVDGPTLYALGILNPRNKRRYESIGVDRLDNNLNYRLTNIVPCCGPCNAIKSGILSHAEMARLGPAVREIWDQRLEGGR